MSKLGEMSTFQLSVMIVFGAAAVIAIGIFAMGGAGGGDSIRATELTLWGSVDRRVIEPWLKENFDDNSAINVNYRYVSVDSFDVELLDKMSIGQGPDMVLISQNKLVRHKDRILPIPFSYYPETRFRETFVDSAEVLLDRRESIMYAFPVLVDPIVMYWNRAYVRESGYTRPPDRWGNLGDFVRANIIRSGDVIERSPVALGEYSNIEHAKEIISTLIFQAGGQIVRGQVSGLEAVLKEDFGRTIAPAVSSIMFYTDFSDPQRSVYSWNRNMPNSLTSFTEEDLVVYFGKTSDFKKISDANPFLDFGVGPVPSNEEGISSSYAEVTGLAVVSTTKNTDASISAVLSMVEPDSLRSLSESFEGVPPAREDLLNNPPQEPFHVPIFYRAAIRSMSWVDPGYKETDEILSELIERVSDKSMDIDRAVNRANLRINTVISETY